MRILFDQGTPVPLRSHLSSHEVATAFERQWSTLTNGELLQQAEAAGYDLLVITDQNLRYQQNLTGRRIAVVVISSTSWPRIQKEPNVGINAERDTPLFAGQAVLEAPPFAAGRGDFQVHAATIGKSPRLGIRLCVLDSELSQYLGATRHFSGSSGGNYR